MKSRVTVLDYEHFNSTWKLIDLSFDRKEDMTFSKLGYFSLVLIKISLRQYMVIPYDFFV